MTTLYRFFDSGDALLYVGIAESFPARCAQHRADKPWWPDVKKMTIEDYPERLDAENAERAAIRAERPRHNVMHNGHATRHKVSPVIGVGTAHLPRDFDQSVIVTLPEYHAARLALDALGRAMDRLAENGELPTIHGRHWFVDAATDMARTSYAGDWCDCCRSQVMSDERFDPICFPYAAEVKGQWMLAAYRCPRTGRQWTCGWTTDMAILAMMP